MKQSLIFRRLFAVLMLMCTCTLSWAYDFAVGGIYYNKNSDDTSVSVTYKTTSYNSYFGSVTIPATVTYSGTTYSVTSIGNYAFDGCSRLTSIKIPNSVTSIGKDAFFYCPSLTSITIPESVTSIGTSAFYDCSKLTSITIPESVTSIGQSVFDGCSSLTSITIPNSVTSIGTSAFYGCRSLPVTDNIMYADTYLVTAVDKTQSNYTIKEGTRFIANSAFSNCTKLASITCLAENVPTTGSDAFKNVSQSSVVLYVPSQSVETYSSKAQWKEFGRILSLEDKEVGIIWKGACGSNANYILYNSGKLDISGTGQMYDYSSDSMPWKNFISRITSVVIEDGVTSIGSYAFSGCSNLTSVTIPNSVTSIGSYAFYGCTSLPVTDNIRYAGPYLVAAVDKSQNSYTIKEGTRFIGDKAFENCSGLKSVTIPHTVKSIGEEVFIGCTNLTSVTCLAENIPTTGETTFNGWIPSSATLYVSVPVVDTYKATTPWGRIGNILPVGDDYLSISCDQKTASSMTCSASYLYSDAKVVSKSITLNDKTTDGSKITLSGLDPGQSYTAKYVATVEYEDGDQVTFVKEVPVATESFTSSTSAPKVISIGNAIIAAQTNLDDVEENVGFEWRRTDWSDEFPSNTGVAYIYEGQIEGYIRNLNTEKLWKFRPYYLSNTGTYYYGDWMGLDPTNTAYFEPTVHTYAFVNIFGNTALVKGYALRGTDNIRVQGFKYWKTTFNSTGESEARAVTATRIPDDAITVESEGRVMETELKNLKYGTTYAYVAFITTTEGETFYGTQQIFTTGEDPTGIDIIEAEEKRNVTEKPLDPNDPIYDLNGRRLTEKPKKGIYIRNGKKYVAPF